MIACNAEYCEWKIPTVLPSCSYTGYCDYQAPRDSRTWKIPEENKDIKDSDLIQ